ncbi:MAG TPA: ferrochelatase, partial [Vicinamibacterales bacterium]|nr:ferrochelatase [Vicinamibacterales bacterium]
IGGSPLIAITTAQAAALAERLGGGALVRAAMRFSAPTIGDALSELTREAITNVVGIVMSPQYSELLMGGYRRAIGEAIATLGAEAPDVRLAGSWHLEPHFISALAERIRHGLSLLRSNGAARVPVLLTAHSLPRRVAEQEPEYIEQLHETAATVAAAADLDADRWKFCWQSAGHEPGEWMKPDFADLMPELAAAGHAAVLVAPIQFLADHLEILYDIDVGARDQAHAAGLTFRRIESLNTDAQFIDALAAVAERTSRSFTRRLPVA